MNTPRHSRHFCGWLLTSCLAGCAGWQTEGRGGFAEHGHEPWYPIEFTDEHDELGATVLEKPVALRIDFDNARNQLDVLVLAGAKRCFPASVKTLTLRQHRVLRELEGGLLDDAALDLQSLRSGIARLRQQMAYAALNNSCAVPDTHYSMSNEYCRRAEVLLNSDNQFAFDSDALNPKYLANLQRAIASLKHHQCVFILTGHTDQLGAERYNLELSQKRAHAVKDALLEQGIDANDVITQGVATHLLYSQEHSAHHRLVNRRVTVQALAKGSASSLARPLQLGGEE